MARRLERARNHGMTRDAADFENIADAFDDGVQNPGIMKCTRRSFNWRANDIQCALGVSQLGKLGRFVARRRALAAQYDLRLSALAPILKPLARTRPCLPAWHLYVARIDFAAAGISRGQLMRALAAEGIGTQVHYYPSIASPITPRVATRHVSPAPSAITNAPSAFRSLHR